MASRSPISVPDFTVDAAADFVSELGALGEEDPDCAGNVVQLIKRVRGNPYHPNLVNECESVSLDNLDFQFRLCAGSTVVHWSILSGSQWTIRFLKIQRLL
jgi:hypothetical protein